MDFAAENKIRQRVLSIFNKREEEFPTLQAYNDYLEEVEDIVFNLCQRVDVAATEARIAAYQAANADSITANRVKRAEEERAAQAAVERASAVEATPTPSAAGEAAMDGTPGGAGGDGTRAMSVTPGAPPQAQGLTFAPQSTFLMAPPAAQPLPRAAPQPLHVSNAGGEPETPEQLRERERIAALASGFTPELVRLRALHDAFDTLVF